MPIIEEECKHCVPVWKLTQLIAYPSLKGVNPQASPGMKYKTSVQLNWTACLEDLRCAPHRRGWEDPPALGSPARPRPTIYPRLVLPPFRAHPRFPAAGAIAVGPPIYAGPGAEDVDITGGFLAGHRPITFEGQIDENQFKVCCKPDVGWANPASPPSQLKSCCSAKRDIICGCYVQGGGKTTVDECCIQGKERNLFTYWTDLDPVTISQHNVFNETQPGSAYQAVQVLGFGGRYDWRALDRSPNQIIIDTIEEALRVAAGAGPLEVRNCTTQSGDPKRFNPPEPSEYPDWSTKCPCRGQVGVEDKCPEV